MTETTYRFELLQLDRDLGFISESLLKSLRPIFIS